MKLITIASTAFLTLTGAASSAQVTFTSDFESGNGTAFSEVASNVFEFEIEPDTNSSDRQWFAFQADGAAGQTLTFRLLNTNSTNVTGHWNNARPVFSIDGGASWTLLPTSATPSGNSWSFSYTFGAEENSVRFAFHYPYTVTMLEAKLPDWEAHPHVTREVLGQSVLGRDIHYFRITNPSPEDSEKSIIWIIARQHSAEVTSSYTVEGFLDSLLSSDRHARALRANAIIHVVPMVNPDGVALGNYRDNANGINLNRVWDGSATINQSPEVRLVQNRIDATVEDAGQRYRYFGDFHSTSGSGPHFAFHSDSSQQPPLYPTPETYFADSRRFLSLVNSYATFFSATRGSSSSSDRRLAYHQQRVDYGVLAFTPEGVYTQKELGPDPNAWLAPDDHRLVGSAFAKALADFFEFEPLDIDSWVFN